MKKTVRQLAESVQDALELEDVHIHWDDATTTGSVYLDLDHGMLGSIRVSDHKGRGNGYLFEIGSHIDKRHTVDKTVVDVVHSVEKFPDAGVKDLVEAVLIKRMRLKALVGVTAYQERVDNDRFEERPAHPKGRRRKSRTRAGNSEQ